MPQSKLGLLLLLLLWGTWTWAQSEAESSTNSLLLKQQGGIIEQEYHEGDVIDFIMIDRHFEPYEGKIEHIGDSTIVVDNTEFPVDKIGSVYIQNEEMAHGGKVVGILAGICAVAFVLALAYSLIATSYGVLFTIAVLGAFLFGISLLPLGISAIVLLALGARKQFLIGNKFRLAIVQVRATWAPKKRQ